MLIFKETEIELEECYRAIEEVQSYLDVKLYIKFQSRDLTQNFIWINNDPSVIYQHYGISNMSVYNSWVLQGSLNESFSPRNYPYITISERTLSYYFYSSRNGKNGPHYVKFSANDVNLIDVKEYIYSSINNTYIWGMTFFTRAVITDIKFINKIDNSEFGLISEFNRANRLSNMITSYKQQKQKLEEQIGIS